MNMQGHKLGIVMAIVVIFIGANSIMTNQPSEEASAKSSEVGLPFHVHELSKRQIEVKEKSLQQAAPTTTSISNDNIEPPKTLEEVIDFNQFPKATVIATGYTAGYESTGKTPDHPHYGITFSGLQVKRDLYSTIAADLNVYPIGTILYIPDYGYGVVADKGSAITGNKIDLYYETIEDVYQQWGKKELDVYLIEMGEGELTEEALLQLNENEALQVFRSQFTTEEY